MTSKYGWLVLVAIFAVVSVARAESTPSNLSEEILGYDIAPSISQDFFVKVRVSPDDQNREHCMQYTKFRVRMTDELGTHDQSYNMGELARVHVEANHGSMLRIFLFPVLPSELQKDMWSLFLERNYHDGAFHRMDCRFDYYFYDSNQKQVGDGNEYVDGAFSPAVCVK